MKKSSILVSLGCLIIIAIGAIVFDSREANAISQCPAPLSFSRYEYSGHIITMKWENILGVDTYEINWCKADPASCFNIADVYTAGQAGNRIFISDADQGNPHFLTGTVNGLEVDSDYNFIVRANSDMSLPSATCSTPGAWAYRSTSTSSCAKDPIKPSADFSVTLSNGAACSVKLIAEGRDVSDAAPESENVSFEQYAVVTPASSSGSFKTKMDDDPSSGCQDNLVFSSTWSWDNGTNILTVTSARDSTSASHRFWYGYTLQSGCAFKKTSQESTVTAGWAFGFSPGVFGDGTNTAGALHDFLSEQTAGVLQSVVQYQITAPPSAISVSFSNGNAWQDANPKFNVSVSNPSGLDKVEYKLSVGGSSRMIQDLNGETSWSDSVKQILLPADWDFLPQGTSTIILKATALSGLSTEQHITIQKDSLSPISTPTIAVPPASGHRPFDNTYWFKAGNYNIAVVDNDDATPGAGKYSDLDTGSCYYMIRDLGTGEATTLASRTCGSTIPLGVNIGSDCVTEGKNKCQLELWSFDRAGNLGFTPRKLHIDRTAPSAQ